MVVTRVAQSVERQPFKLMVEGSSPFAGAFLLSHTTYTFYLYHTESSLGCCTIIVLDPVFFLFQVGFGWLSLYFLGFYGAFYFYTFFVSYLSVCFSSLACSINLINLYAGINPGPGGIYSFLVYVFLLFLLSSLFLLCSVFFYYFLS